MTRGELLLRRVYGQHLLTGADAVTIARDLCGVQTQFFAAPARGHAALRVSRGL